MLILSVWVLGAALLIGLALAILAALRRGAPSLPLALLHGGLAVGGLACLAVALQGPPRGASTGTASFGLTAAILLALAIVPGGALLAAHLRRRRLPGALIGVHGFLAVSGFVILAVYVLAG